jgi:hypothetical protein
MNTGARGVVAIALFVCSFVWLCVVSIHGPFEAVSLP